MQRDENESSMTHQKQSLSRDIEGTSNRRWARVGTAVLFLGVLIALAALVWTRGRRATTLAEQGGCPGEPCPVTPMPVDPGGARPWEIGIPVSSYSTWNSRTGNLVTAIPITGLSGLGPPIGIALFHNSVSVAASFDVAAGMGFDLGPGWTTSYSSQMILDDSADPTEVTVVHDDGTQDIYTKSGEYWLSPPGVASYLEYEYVDTGGNCTGDIWTLKNADQSQLVYMDYESGDIYLCKIIDPVGHELIIHRDSNVYGNRIVDIEGAHGRWIDFEYDMNGRLESVTDPGDQPGQPDRSWTLAYDANGRVVSVTDPGLNVIDVTYDSDNHIATLSDKHVGTSGDEYSFAYDTLHRLESVTDPDQGLTQGFAIEECCPTLDRTATYTDRRGNDWIIEYALFGERDGNLSGITDPLGNIQTFAFDANRHLTSYEDALNKEWTFAFDESGDILTATDPLQHTRTWTYDWFNNLRSYSDAAGNTVTFKYDNASFQCDLTSELCATCSAGSANAGASCIDNADCDGGTCDFDASPCKVCSQSLTSCTTDGDCPVGESCGGSCVLVGHPTLLTESIEPADGQGNPARSTLLEYFTSPEEDGLVKTVNCGGGGVGGVSTQQFSFAYDDWGYQKHYTEGEQFFDGGVPSSQLKCQTIRSSIGHILGSSCSPCGKLDYNSMCSVTGSSCCYSCNPTECPCNCLRQSSSSLVPYTFPKLPSDADTFPDVSGGFSGAQYSPKQELTSLPATVTIDDGGPQPDVRDRTHSTTYDDLGRITYQDITTDESGAQISRPFSYDFANWANGSVTRTGPDGVETYVAFDEAYRVTTIRRSKDTTILLEANVTYYDNGLVQSVAYRNGTRTTYTYDDANRVTVIEHWDDNAPGALLLKLLYSYTVNNLVSSVTEQDAMGTSAVSTFTYDNRGRLIHEIRNDYRQMMDHYDIAYTYDQAGNRLTKTEQTNSPGDTIVTTYTYDIQDKTYYMSALNRLMEWKKELFSQGGGQESASYGGGPTVSSAGLLGGAAPAAPENPQPVLLEHAWYFYNPEGSVTREVRMVPGTGGQRDQYSATRLGYAMNGSAVVFVEGESWEYPDNNPQGDPDTDSYMVNYSREFRYDGARQRYYRKVNNVATTWSDYDGDSIYTDYTTPFFQVTEQRSFEPGIGRFDWTGGVPDPATARYYHADLIGTTRFMTNYEGTMIQTGKYTAFGEPVSGPAKRFGYAGSWGYQTDDSGEFPFIHVGNRYYDPEIGRFLQRDPSGIAAGTNVYAYVLNMPTVGVDPVGRGFWSAIGGAIGGIIGGAITGAITGGGIPGAIGGAIAGGISGAVSGGLGGGGFGSGFVAGTVNGAIAGVGGGIAGGLAGSGASAGKILGGSVIGGAVSGGLGSAYNGGSRGQIIAGTAVGGAFGLLGGLAGESGQSILNCVFAADAETIGGAIGRLP